MIGLSCQDGLCKCGAYSYWKVSKCVLFSGYNQKCAGNDECDKSKNLACRDGLCLCKDASLNWDEKSSSCSKIFLKLKFQ